MEKELRVRFTGDAQDLRRAAQDAERAMREVERTQDQTGLSAADLGKKLGGLAAAYLSLQAASAAAQKGLQGLASIEQSELTFEVLFGSADKAKRKMEELVTFAAKTPFELPGIVDAAKALETFGLSSTKYLKDAGDLAAAFNVDISEVARAFGRINSGDFGEAFERMRDFGISRQMLEGEGLVFDKSGSYQGSVDQALTAVQAIIQRKFGGMMERQADTFSGQMSTLSDNVQTALNTVMEPAFNSLNETVKQLNTSLDGAFGEEMQANARVLGDVIGGVTTAALALGKATGDTLREIMAPLRWMKDTATALGKGAGERDVAKSLVMSSGINPNRAQHYASLVGRGEDIQNISNDFRVKSWGDPKGVQEDLGKIATAIAKARMIVDGTIQYNNYEPYGPTAPPGGVNGNGNTNSNSLKGLALAEAQHGVGQLSDASYLKALNQELSKTTKNTEEYFKVLAKIKALEKRGVKDKFEPRTADGVGGLYGPAFDYGDKFFGPADGRDYLKFQEVQGKQTEDLGARIERETMAYVRQQERARKEAERLAADIQKKADDALRSGLEAGVSAFLDGGLQGFGSSIYSLSKQSFSKALVDSVMSNADLKNALGGLGHSLGGAGGVGAALAIGSVIWDTGSKVKGIWDESQAFNDAKGTRNSLGNLKSVSTVFGNTAKVGASHLASFSDAIKGSERQVEVDLALGKITETQAQAARGQIDAAKQLYEASKSQFDAAEEMKKSIEEDRREYKQKVALDYKEAVAKAQGRDLEAEDIGSWISRQQEWLATNTKGNSRLEDVAEGGFTTDEIIGLIGDGKNNKGSLGKQDEWLRQELRDLLIAQVNLGDRGGAAQSVGSLSNPDNALAFDAPVSRTVNNAFNIGIQTYAITGDKASIKDLARIMAAEIANIQGQAV